MGCAQGLVAPCGSGLNLAVVVLVEVVVYGGGRVACVRGSLMDVQTTEMTARALQARIHRREESNDGLLGAVGRNGVTN